MFSHVGFGSIVFLQKVADHFSIVGVDLSEMIDSTLLNKRLSVLQMSSNVSTQILSGLRTQHLVPVCSNLTVVISSPVSIRLASPVQLSVCSQHLESWLGPEKLLGK